MTLFEANNRLNKKISQEQLQQIGNLYTMLNIDKDHFCKILDTVGVDVLTEQTERYEKLFLEAKNERKRQGTLELKKQVTYHIVDKDGFVSERCEILMEIGEPFEYWLSDQGHHVEVDGKIYTVLEQHTENGEEVWRKTERKYIRDSAVSVEVSRPITNDITELII